MNLIEFSQVFGNFGEFFGAIAVLMTLAYLAVEVRRAGYEEMGIGGPLVSSLTGNENWERHQRIIARIKETQ